MKISHFPAKYAILAAILNFRTLAVSNVIGSQIFWQIRILRQIWPWKQPVLFQICIKSSDMPNPTYTLSITASLIFKSENNFEQVKRRGKWLNIQWGKQGKKWKKLQPNVSKSQAFLQRGQIGRDNMQWQTLIAKCLTTANICNTYNCDHLSHIIFRFYLSIFS